MSINRKLSSLLSDYSQNISFDNNTFYLDSVNNNVYVGGTGTLGGTANRATVFSANKFGLSIIDTTAQSTGVGGALNLGGNYRSSNDAQAFTRIAAYKENSTDTNYAYAMTFSTTPNGGSFTERARIDSSGNLLVGGTDSNPVGNGGTYRNFVLTAPSSGYVAFDGISDRTAADVTIASFAAGTTGASSGKFVAAVNMELDGTSTTNAVGRIVFYTASAGSAVERARIDSSGNLGVGVTSPAWPVDVNGIVASRSNSLAGIRFQSSANGYNGYIFYETSTSSLTFTNYNSGPLVFKTNDAERARIDSSGNLLVGATSTRASAKLDIRGNVMTLGSNASYYATIDYNAGSGLLSLASESGGGIVFKSGSTERARIDSSGNLLVGTTNAAMTDGGLRLGKYSGYDAGQIVWSNNSGTTLKVGVFFWSASATEVGSISTNNAGTTYATSSDYRMKNIDGPLTGYKERILSITPEQGTWVSDGSEFRGFVAHKFAQTYPKSVVGEKDDVDDNGKPVYQAMQASSSEVMADIVATLKDLITENQSLKAENDLLKARLDAANL